MSPRADEPDSASAAPPASASRSPWRRRLGLSIAAACLGLSVAEIALQVWARLGNPPLYVLDPRLGWTHAPGADRALDDGTGRRVRFSIDARGLRATPHANTRTAGRRRVLVVGDSFTQGSQVEADELFTTGIERQVPDVEVWNAGVGGYSTLQELLALPAHLAASTPDLVVLVVFENDLQDNLMPYFSGLGPRPHLRVQGGTCTLVPTPDPAPFTRFLMPAPGALWLYRHCALYRTLHKHVFLPAWGHELAALEQAEREALAEDDERTAMAWSLARIAQLVQDAKGRLLVAAIPPREEVREGNARSHAWLATQCRTLQVPFLSLLAPLQATTAERAFFAHDIHLTVAGHASVAAALAPAVAAALQQPR